MLTGQQILTASFNDIVFQDRNRGYGAYVLRKDYNRHMKLAMGTMMGFCLASFAWYFTSPFTGTQKDASPFIPDLEVIIHPQPVIPLPPLPPVQQAPPRAFRSEIFTTPVIVSTEVEADDLPPEQEVLEKSVIGLEKSPGEEIGNIVAPPAETRSVAPVVALVSEDAGLAKVWTKVENPAEFPGGPGEWSRYLQKNLRYPDAAIENGTQAVVRVQFVVDRDGNISEVVPLNDPGDGLAEEAVRIIKKGPKWKPAEQNGKKVIYRHTQAIVFRLD